MEIREELFLQRKKQENKKVLFGNQGRTIFAAMSILFIVGLTICFTSEMAGNPALEQVGLNQDMGSMEGKEVRFGIAQSTLFTTTTTTTTTTSFTTGTVNNMHDTLTPLGGMVPMLHMMLNCVFGGKGVGLMNMIMYVILAVFLCGLMIGRTPEGTVNNMHDTLTPLGGRVPMLHMMLNCVFGGKGVGLMNMIMYVILAVFLCGLMIGRTPEYLCKKIEGKEMKLVSLVLIFQTLLILGFSALAVMTGAGQAGITNEGFHGLSQVLYEYASSAANNGSGFEGLADNSYFWNWY